MISTIILAAGRSSRVGGIKALLPIYGKSFIEHLIDLFLSAGIGQINVVLGYNRDDVEIAIKNLKCKIVINPEPRRGQLSSIICGIESLPPSEISGAFICPVDYPLISRGTITSMIQAFNQTRKGLVVPTFNKKRGRPILFSSSIFKELKKAPREIGARYILDRFPDEVLEVPVKDEGILININTCEDYERYIKLRGFNSEI